MKERDFQTRFTTWAKHFVNESSAFELKLTKTPSLPFDALRPHQRDALYHAAHGHIFYKIPDDTIGQKPCDAIMLVHVPAYVVVQFYRPGNKEFFMIHIDQWVNEERISTRRSLTEERARVIGKACVLA